MNKPIEQVVEEYFKEYDIEDLMEYGSDEDSHNMPTISDVYKNILDKLNIPYNSIVTEDVSDGKYATTIELEDGTNIIVDTSARNGVEIVASNVEDISKKYEEILEEEDEFEM